MKDFSIDEYELRIRKFQQFMSSSDITLAVLTQATDIYYYSGSAQPLYLLIPAEGKGLALVRKAFERSQSEITHLPSEIFNNTSELAIKLSVFDKRSVAFSFDTVSYATVNLWQKKFELKNIIDISWDIRLLRMTKSEKEIEILQEAGRIISGIPAFIKKIFRQNMTELELSAEIEKYLRLNENNIIMKCRREGVECIGLCAAGINTLQGTKFDGISAGKGLSAAFPYGASDEKIREGSPCIIDFGFNYKGYHIDQTRMFSYKRPPEAVLKAYTAMVEIEERLFDIIRPGIKWFEVYDYSIQLADEKGFEMEFMGLGIEKVRFIGHGVGLELDEPPFLAPKMDYPIEIGSVIAVEPKVSLPGIGVVGIEDTIAVTESGYNILTNAPRDYMIL